MVLNKKPSAWSLDIEAKILNCDIQIKDIDIGQLQPLDAQENEKAQSYLLKNLTAKDLISTTDVVDLREQISREALKFAMKMQELMRCRRTNEEKTAYLESSIVDDMLGELFINMADVFSFKKDKKNSNKTGRASYITLHENWRRFIKASN